MISLSEETRKLLDILENAIDPETEDDYIAQWQTFIDKKSATPLFRPKRKKKPIFTYENRFININDALEDYELMLVSQVQGALGALKTESCFPAVRCNYGIGILPSLFGAELFIMPYNQNTLPSVRPMGTGVMDSLLEKGIPDLTNGFGGKVLEMGEIYREVFSKYPKIQKYVDVYHPDAQGTLDIAEVLLGSDIFYSYYDEPEKLKEVMSLITETYIAFMDKWYTMFPKTPDRSTHWGTIMYRGNILLRDDSAMNLSPDCYREFAYPYDAKLLEYYDGGAVHFCGRGDHYIGILSECPYLYGINMSQPELNDMEIIYQNTVDKGIPILGFNYDWAQKALKRPGAVHGLVSV